MANPEHLKILKQGVEVWNRWREENPGVIPDLRDFDLQNARLLNADLNLAKLTGADLRDAHLLGADLTFARLSGANLSGAILRGADLSNARLINANLGAVDLVRANLSRTNLYGSRLSGTTIGWATIVAVDLSQTECLESVEHSGPSGVATSTLEQTAVGLVKDSSRQGEVKAFLRRAGVSESYYDTLRLSIGQPIEFFSCFISYSHADKSFARRLHDQLQARGIRCWLDEHDMKPGDRILDVVNDAIRLHDKILLCCSETSLRSWWVKDEIRKAQARERKEDRLIIIPLNLDGYLFQWNDGLADDIRSRLAADFTGWEHDNAKFEEQFERVVKALRANEGGARECGGGIGVVGKILAAPSI